MKRSNLSCMVPEVIKIKPDTVIAELYLMDNTDKTLNTSYFLNEVKSRVLHVSQCVRFNKFKSNTQSEFGST